MRVFLMGDRGPSGLHSWFKSMLVCLGNWVGICCEGCVFGRSSCGTEDATLGVLGIEWTLTCAGVTSFLSLDTLETGPSESAVNSVVCVFETSSKLMESSESLMLPSMRTVSVKS